MEEKDLVSPLLWNEEASSASSEDMCDPNPGVQRVIIQTRNKQISKNTLKKFSISCYVLFLLVRLFTLIVYIGRTIICCTKESKASFQCGDGAFMPYDMEVELAWLISSIINIAICLRVMFSWHELAGMKVLIRKLVKLPGFWSLIFLFLVSCSGLFIMTIKNKNSFFQIASFFLFGAQNILITTVVAVLNYTEVSKFMELKGYQRKVRIFMKLTQILLFIEFFSLFLIGTMQFGFQVTGLDYTAKASRSFRKVFGEMRRFGEMIYYYNMMTFLWKKLFVDNRDILSHMQLLHDYHSQYDCGFNAAP